MKGLRPLVYDSGNQTRCFTYVQDALIALELLMSTKKSRVFDFKAFLVTPTQ